MKRFFFLEEKKMFLSYFEWNEAKEGSVFYILYQSIYLAHIRSPAVPAWHSVLKPSFIIALHSNYRFEKTNGPSIWYIYDLKMFIFHYISLMKIFFPFFPYLAIFFIWPSKQFIEIKVENICIFSKLLWRQNVYNVARNTQ